MCATWTAPQRVPDHAGRHGLLGDPVHEQETARVAAGLVAVQGDRGVSEWTFTGTRADGSRVDVHGCDLFTFRDGKIATKDSYRKNRAPLV